jgi:hypothetical protein
MKDAGLTEDDLDEKRSLLAIVDVMRSEEPLHQALPSSHFSKFILIAIQSLLVETYKKYFSN